MEYWSIGEWREETKIVVTSDSEFGKMPQACTLRPVEILDTQAFKLENGLLRLVESLERKRDFGIWTESLIVSESNSIYTADNPDAQTPN